jgi:hypothetical protein
MASLCRDQFMRRGSGAQLNAIEEKSRDALTAKTPCNHS